MYARLNAIYGWTWLDENGIPGPFILENIEQYHGMITGYNTDGRKATRPATEFDALSHDGVTWHPVKDLLSQVPREGRSGRVRTRDVHLPAPGLGD